MQSLPHVDHCKPAEVFNWLSLCAGWEGANFVSSLMLDVTTTEQALWQHICCVGANFQILPILTTKVNIRVWWPSTWNEQTEWLSWMSSSWSGEATAVPHDRYCEPIGKCGPWIGMGYVYDEIYGGLGVIWFCDRWTQWFLDCLAWDVCLFSEISTMPLA